MIFTEQEWRRAGSFLIMVSPHVLLVLVVFFLGFLSGHGIANTEIAKDCKYAQAFRVELESYTCQRKL
jgi:hypothetical protein